LRTRIKIGIAPKLRILGYLDPAQHLLEIGGTVIMVLLQFYYLLSFHFAHFTTIWNSMCDQSCWISCIAGWDYTKRKHNTHKREDPELDGVFWS